MVARGVAVILEGTAGDAELGEGFVEVADDQDDVDAGGGEFAGAFAEQLGGGSQSFFAAVEFVDRGIEDLADSGRAGWDRGFGREGGFGRDALNGSRDGCPTLGRAWRPMIGLNGYGDGVGEFGADDSEMVHSFFKG